MMNIKNRLVPISIVVRLIAEIRLYSNVYPEYMINRKATMCIRYIAKEFFPRYTKPFIILLFFIGLYEYDKIMKTNIEQHMPSMILMIGGKSIMLYP